MFGVPRSTLHDHVSGKLEQFAEQGPKPYLKTEEEEEELASFWFGVLGLDTPIHVSKLYVSFKIL